MTGSPVRRRITGLALGVLLGGLALSGCTSPAAAPPGPSPEVTSAAPSPSASTAASPSASASAAPTPSETSAAADQLTIDITIADGQVTPNGKKLDVKVGQTIVLNVTSDEDDEVHAHTEGDGYELEAPAGKKVSGTFSINAPGSYEVESHHLEKVIAILNAR